MIISVASGKGGTGKTTVAVNLALSINEDVLFLDCDVEEPNAHIFINPVFAKKEPVSIPVPRIDETKCDYCGKCQEVCEYHAIAVINKKVLIFPELCHGCGGCKLFCPQKAIDESGKVIGFIESGAPKNPVYKLHFIHGKLNIGEAMSPPLIRAVKRNIDGAKTVIIDAPPGTSCPVIASVKGSDYCILVTEPTPFGLNDLILAVEVIRKLNIPFCVVINRAGLGNEEVDVYCKKEDIPVLMRIPFDRKIAEAYSNGIPMVETLPEYRENFIQFYKNILEEKRVI